MAHWIGVGLDGVLSKWSEDYDPEQIGQPIIEMVDRVHEWIKNGYEVRIVSERAINDIDAIQVEAWLDLHNLPMLAITNAIDAEMIALWHDRAIHVGLNTGQAATPSELLAYLQPKDNHQPAGLDEPTSSKSINDIDAEEIEDEEAEKTQIDQNTSIDDNLDLSLDEPLTTTLDALEANLADEEESLSAKKIADQTNNNASENNLRELFEQDENPDILSDTSLDDLFNTIDTPSMIKRLK